MPVLTRPETLAVAKAIGERLHQLRRAKDQTLATVADRVDITAQQLCKYELGRNLPPADMVVRLADYYGVTTDFVLRGETADAA